MNWPSGRSQPPPEAATHADSARGFYCGNRSKRKKPVLLGGKDRLEPTSTAAEPQGVSHCLRPQYTPSAKERSTSKPGWGFVADLLRGLQLFRNKLPLANRACVYGVQSVCQITHMCLRGHAVSTNVSTNVSWFAPGLRVLQLFRNKLPLPNMACAKWCAKCDLLVIYW